MALFSLKDTLSLIVRNPTYKSYITNVSCLPGSEASRLRHSLPDQSLAIFLSIYYDEFEMTNPIGAYRKRHKIGAFYFGICNLSVSVRYVSIINSVFILKFCHSQPFIFPIIAYLGH